MGQLYGTYSDILNEVDLPFLDSSQVRRKSVGLTLDASAFSADGDGRKIVKAGTVVGVADGESKYKEVVKAVVASKSIGSGGSNNLIVYSANVAGVVGNEYSVLLTDHSHDSRAATEASYDPFTKVITVHLKNDGAAITATAQDVIDVLTASGVQAALAIGTGDAEFKVTAREAGFDGNAISIALIDPSGNSQPLSVDYDDGVITVNLATDGSGDITSTAADIIAALNADVEASALIYAELASGSDGTGVVSAASAADLLGGSDATPITAANGTGSDGTGVVAAASATALTGGVAQNVTAKYITAETVELTDGDDVVAVFDQARVRASRLETTVDDAIKAELSGFDFV